ncbi:MAG: hypothetical protein HY868_04845 [Chloroflexi bacterium]|nr:hypothetical protein [Chloroflexota bacterium]
MKSLAYHLPIALVAFLLALLLATDLAFTRDARVLATLLAPTLWIGLDVLFGKAPARQ